MATECAFPRVHEITETVIAAAAGTVVLGRRALHAGSVWVVVDGWRYGPLGEAGAARLVCVHHGHFGWVGAVWTVGQLRADGGLWSDIWRIAPATDAVRGTPARRLA